MKKIFFAALAFSVLGACTPQGPQPIEIKGNIQNLETGYGLVESRGITDTVWVEENGDFLFTSEILSPQYFTVRTGRIRNKVFICPGDVTIINFDTEDKDRDVTFEGDGKEYNLTLRKVNTLHNKLTQDFMGLFGLPKEDFISKLDSLKLQVEELIAPFNHDKKPFAEFERARTEYFTLGLLANYPNYHAYATSKEPEIINSNDFIEGVDIKNSKHIGIDEYASLLESYIQKLYGETMQGDRAKGTSDFEKSLIYFELVDSLLGRGPLADLINHSHTKDAIRWSSLETAKNISEHYMEMATSEDYIMSIRYLLDKRLLLAPGQPAPKFTLEGFDGKTYSLDDFKGKLVYLDFWATWCGPCRREIPHLKQLKNEYKGKPVAFIAISVDDDKEAWEKMVKSEKLDGIQLYAPKAWLNETTIQYQVVGIPTFVLIDGEGKIIEYPASRPSQEETKLLLNKHLKSL